MIETEEKLKHNTMCPITESTIIVSSGMIFYLADVMSVSGRCL